MNIDPKADIVILDSNWWVQSLIIGHMTVRNMWQDSTTRVTHVLHTTIGNSLHFIGIPGIHSGQYALQVTYIW